VESNISFVEEFCREHIPQIVPIRPEASFLVWLDCRALNLSQEALVDLFVNKAKLALNDGAMFGVQGEGFMRLNVGTPREIVHQALRQLQKALDL
jgi:cystathionine beta-lyase